MQRRDGLHAGQFVEANGSFSLLCPCRGLVVHRTDVPDLGVKGRVRALG